MGKSNEQFVTKDIGRAGTQRNRKEKKRGIGKSERKKKRA